MVKVTLEEFDQQLQGLVDVFGTKIKDLLVHYPLQFRYYWNLYHFYLSKDTTKELTKNERREYPESEAQEAQERSEGNQQAT